MRDDRHDFASAMIEASLGGFDKGAAGIGHVVDKNGHFVADVADEGHFGNFVGAGALFVDEGEVEVEAVGYGGCSCCLRQPNRSSLKNIHGDWEGGNWHTS